ncbi:S-adenosylmethionine:tRNA ribosyltransferase-isomerase [Aureispira anguillae]|uniref:S-adenosylmethionine:tRNA ribosyltransferase-isomerase n=1 Tax=Aureispira anguillae TaxID=2864201 RepID=A0A915VK48_9BACT|nr:S-adenosylmethionine:tRNA ribosyltransferase-isomerase [Aureispira anguillae]BDS09517.1 S-adenosylmethionine:tRNA ribosyltransferase-isomerase [Aureispira anguillae]
MNTLINKIIEFDLPKHLACPKPTEQRNIARDGVRLLVTNNKMEHYHDTFSELENYLEAGDVLVVNTSATLPSAFELTLPNGKPAKLHLSTKLNAKDWLVEIRAILGTKTIRWKEGQEGMQFKLPNGANLVLKKRFYKNQQFLDLWIAELQMEENEMDYMQTYGQPIKYTQLDNPFPMDYYQTFFSYHPGSAEMPSAGRGFTSELVSRLAKKGVLFVPILLHTGISSLEENEKPYPEYMEISPLAALLINKAKEEGRRVIAVGTTAIRAIESAAKESGRVAEFRGNTELFIHESYRMKVTDGLLTGFHEPKASHLNILQALVGYQHLKMAYEKAIEANYFWHQFGDLHLILAD